MRRKSGKVFMIVIIVALLVSGLTGGLQYYLWNKHMAEVDQTWEIQVQELEATIINVGELLTVFTVITPGIAGDVILQENLKPVQVPSSFVGGSYVYDPITVAGSFYKVDVQPGTPLTSDLVMSEDIDDTMREVDITALTWPVGLKATDYVDFEITYPMGEVYTVLSHVRVREINSNTIKVHLTGIERHMYSASLVDYFLNSRNGATISLTKYIEPGVQKAAIVYYAIPANILAIITADPNLLEKVDAAVNAQSRVIIETGVSNIDQQIGGMISAGRADLQNKSTAASSAFWQAEKERLDKEAYDAAAAAGTYVPPVDATQPTTTTPAEPGENLNIGEGVVE